MKAAVALGSKPISQELRYYFPRWMTVFVVITLIEQLSMFPPTGRGLWYIPALIVAGLLEGASAGLVFVGLQRLWNPSDSRVVRLRNYFAAVMIVGVGSLGVMIAIHS